MSAHPGSCIGQNPTCPCQDGDACHYEDTPTTKGWPVPDDQTGALRQQPEAVDHDRAAHTPGPWAYSQWRETDGEGELMAYGWQVTAGGHLLPMCAQTGDVDEAEANARLIAVAPELLEAASLGHCDSPSLSAGDLLAAANVLRNHGHDDLAARLEEKHQAEQIVIAKALGEST